MQHIEILLGAISTVIAIAVGTLKIIKSIEQNAICNKQISETLEQLKLADIRHDEAIENLYAGSKAMLMDKLNYLCEKYILRGYITAIELQIITTLYEGYKSVKGNKFIDELFERAKNLELRK